jgi:hypothetical protein
MRFLNGMNFQGNYVNAIPEIHKIVIKDKVYIYDVNSMMLWETHAGAWQTEKITDSIISEIFGTDQAPFCQPMGESCHKMLVFQVTYACTSRAAIAL